MPHTDVPENAPAPTVPRPTRGALEPLRTGLLGTGPWARMTHAPALRDHPDVTFAGVWGRRPEAADALAEEFGTHAYHDVDALLADCDAVAVALPPDVQAPLAVRAARAGCHLLLDKPVATTPGAAGEVAEAVAAHGVASVVFFTLHFSASTADWIEEQTRTGDWLLGRADWLSPVMADAASPFADSPWRRTKGALWDVGPHALSVLLPVLGDTTEVRAAYGPGDTAHLTLRHSSGASSTVTVSHTVPQAASGVFAELRGPAGVVTMPVRDEDPTEAFASAVQALLDAVRTGTPHPCDIRFGARITEVLARAEATADGRVAAGTTAPVAAGPPVVEPGR